MALAIVPAAGRSRRMGRPKPLLPFRGTTFVAALVDGLVAAGVRAVAVVTAPGDRAIAAWAAAAAAVVPAVNPEPGRGMLSSVQAGLDALGGAAALVAGGEPLVVCPVDVPAVRPQTVRTLIERVRTGGALLAVPVYRRRRGHPLVVAPAAIAEIPTLDAGVGLRQLLARHPEETAEVPVEDPGTVANVNTREDLRRLQDLA